MTIDMFTYRPDAPDAPVPAGPLSGKSVVIQPDLSARGWLTDAGTKALSGFHAIFDATLISRLKAAGAVIAGSARMAELGFGINGSTLARILAAEDDLHAGLMTDTLGEARMAACLAGLWGFKPTWGRLSRHGLTGLAPSLECTAVLAKQPADILPLLSVLAGADDNDPSMRPDPALPVSIPSNSQNPEGKSVCIGVPAGIPVSSEMMPDTAFSRAKDTMAKAGVSVREITLPDLNLFSATHQVIAAVEASSSAGKYDGVRYGFRNETEGNWNDMYLASRGAAFGPLIKEFLMQGAYFQFQDYAAFEAACILRRKLLDQTEALFKQVDFLALPTRTAAAEPATAATIPDTYEAFNLTLAASLMGLPVLHVPGLATTNNTKTGDYGLQLIGPCMGDADVLAVAHRLVSQGVFSS